MESFRPKQPYEEYYNGFNFAEDLGTTETIFTAAVTVIDLADNSDKTATITDAGKQVDIGAIVYFWVRGGSTGKIYKITCKIVGDEGSKYEQDGIMHVREK
jgi:hypothetical protein